MKAQKYSNTFQIHEQRGNFNGIDTYSITQFRNFKITYFLLQENESRSICDRPDINTLLDHFGKENLIPFEYGINNRNIAKSQTQTIDLNDLCYNAKYISAKKDILIQQTDDIVPVVCDGSLNEEENETVNIIHTSYMTSQYPSTLYPCQKYNDYGAISYMISLFSSFNKNTFMLWMLFGMLT